MPDGLFLFIMMVMLLDFLAKLFKRYLLDIPYRILLVAKRSFYLLDNKLGARLNLHLLFTPLFGDKTFIGKVIGFALRVIAILFGFYVILVFEIILFLMLGAYFYLLYAVLKYNVLAGSSLFISIHGYYYFLKPRTTFFESKKGDPVDYLIHPNSKKFLKKILEKRFVAYPEELYRNKNITFLMKKFDLLPVDLTSFLITQVSWKPDRKTFLDKAYEVGERSGATYIGDEVLFATFVSSLPDWRVFLQKQEKKDGWLIESLSFVYWAKKRRKTHFIWDKEYKIPLMGGVNRGLTSRVTPILNQYSTDLTSLAAKGVLPELVGRDDLLEKCMDILSKDRKRNLLIVGKPGSGKTTFVGGIARRIVMGTKYKSLAFKRLVSLNSGAFFGSKDDSGKVGERLNSVLAELEVSGGIIAFIDEIHTIVSVSAENPKESAVFAILEQKLTNGAFQFIATTTPDDYTEYIEHNKSFSRVFERVDLPEASKDETLKILMLNSYDVEMKKNIIISYPAIALCVDLSNELIYDRVNPDKAVDVLDKAIQVAKKEGGAVVQTEHVRKAVEQISKIPLSSISSDTKKKMLNLEKLLHKWVVNQREGVKAVVDAMQRGVAGTRDPKKPFAVLLFLGPTGVGKTETAKALAKAFYGGEDKIIRFDMNQYQQKDDVVRLVAALTAKIKRNPYSLILLDEFEKAHKELLSTFLQLFDEGSMKDLEGGTVKFNNTIIIATSNVGSKEIFDNIRNGVGKTEIKEDALKAARGVFSPELLNRFSSLVVYEPLGREEILEITKIKLRMFAERMKKKGITLEFTEDLINKIAQAGTSREYGARRLERVIAEKVETPIAKEILKGKLKPGSKKVIDVKHLEFN